MPDVSPARVIALPFLLWLCSCSSLPAPDAAAAASEPPTVVLVSLDGVRPDALGRGDTPTLDALAADGVQAWMRPSYPSLTFPNHYTLVTGLRPDRHGLIHNSMYDAELGEFRLSDREAVSNGDWYADGEPVWVTAERAGLPTATLSWPGSEAAVRGLRPTRWLPYDEGRPIDTRVATMLEWLDEPSATRPRLATLYFEHPDKAGHDYGPNSPQYRQALRDVDAALGRLMDGIRSRGLLDRVNLLVLSDHGMAEVPTGQVIAVESMASREEARIVSTGQVIGLVPNPGFEAAVAARLLGAHAQYDCWRREAMPARWQFGTHPRVPPIVCQMHPGWDAISEAGLARRPQRTRGSHGYDPDLPEMRAMFVAHGPVFRRGVTLDGFDNVDVYPLLTRLLGIEAQPNDGDPATLLPALRERAR
ncbi:ectonucleotide pyrophosphatase/phosphodiesterase [Luteimonas deserti]|nr:ectonucleotide pyrophosphatase/phosphodiesterase [Luteimonas deserti]